MFVLEERSSEFCFLRTDGTLAGRRLFASATPLETERYPATDQTTSRMKSASSVTHVQRFHVQLVFGRRTTWRPLPSPPLLRYVFRSPFAPPPFSGTFPLVRPPL